MADFVVSLALQKLGDFLNAQVGDFLSDRVGIFKGVREDVEWLREELEWMQCSLKDAEENQVESNRAKKWISNISDVAYETIDILETYSLNVGCEPPRRGIMDRIKLWVRGSSISNDIKSVREKVQEISRRRKAYGIKKIGDEGQGTSACLNNRQIRRTNFDIHEDHVVVRFDDEAKPLLVKLIKEEPRRCIILIDGKHGSGKTTLARKLYYSPKVRGRFCYQAWVCNYKEHRIEDLLRSIIKSFKRLTREELAVMEKMTEEELEQHLHEFLKGSRYLVVVDEVWDNKEWKILSRAFPDSNNGSRVIVTTSNNDVAIAADDRTIIHKLQFLSIEESWDLFCKKAFPRDGEVDYRSAKEMLGREMIEKCTGRLLAIIVLGGLLLHKTQLEEWNMVKENIWSHLGNDSTEISQLLSIVYYHLSSEMKWCFLYLGMFPEDYEIDAQKLKFLWIAEEFIPKQERMEDEAEKYLNELINRNLIQVTSREGSRIAKCKVHHLLWGFVVEKAREVKFFDIFDPRKNSPSRLRCPRHAVHSHILDYFLLNHSNLRLRSLVFFNPDHECLETMHLKFISTKFKSLRVLAFGGVTFSREYELPDTFGELIHLKLLWLLNTNISKLPPFIGNLKCLQFLEAYGNSTCKLPDEICIPNQLIYISAKLEGRLVLKTVTNLQTLRYVDYKQWLEIDTVNLINLRSLEIQKLSTPENETYSLNSITTLKSLVELRLESSPHQELPPLQPLSSCQHLNELHLRGRIQKLPPINELPTGLDMLKLEGSKLEEDPMPTLEQLPNLRFLCLSYRSYEGKKMVCTSGMFCKLDRLELNALTELEEWLVEEGAMPLIRTFVMFSCHKLKLLPEKMRSVIIEVL